MKHNQSHYFVNVEPNTMHKTLFVVSDGLVNAFKYFMYRHRASFLVWNQRSTNPDLIELSKVGLADSNISISVALIRHWTDLYSHPAMDLSFRDISLANPIEE